MHKSSSPTFPPAPLILAKMRRTKARKAKEPPTSPAMDTSLVRSMTGAPHVSFEYLSVAVKISCGWPN